MISPSPTIASPVSRTEPEQGKWTFEDWLRLPDNGYRYEIIDGGLYMVPPPDFVQHQRPIARLFNWMYVFVETHQLGEVGIAPAGVRLPNQPVPFQPDIFFYAAGRADVRFGQYIEGAPDLIVEVLSPSNWLYDRQEKFAVYESAGVREYWIVDPRMKTIEVFVWEQGTYTLINKWGAGQRAQSQVLRGFEIAIDELFQ
ncbi:MAG: Uma2 family endonuclease [Chloroflexi bacterium]|nr:Uma2 family endonuclease [Chloroflexota bacterium]